MAPSAAYIISMHAGSQTGEAPEAQAIHRWPCLATMGCQSGVVVPARAAEPLGLTCATTIVVLLQTHLPDCRVRAGRASSFDSAAFMAACSAARWWRCVRAG